MFIRVKVTQQRICPVKPSIWTQLNPTRNFPVALTVKNLPAMPETWVQSLSREDPLEKGRLPTPVFWPGLLHGRRSLTGYSPRGQKESGTTE